MFEVELDIDRRLDPGVQCYLRMISRFELLTRERECALAARIRQGDRNALDELVNANLRFVVSVARKFLNRGLSYMDLIAEGNVGLITAARRFDERRGFRFISFAVWWIRQAIQKGLGEKINTVRLPLNRVQQTRALKTAERRLEQERQRPVTEEEVAETVAIPVRKARLIRQASRPTVSLDNSAGEDELPLGDLLVDSETITPEEGFLRRELRAELVGALDGLTRRERDIVFRYYGLGLEDGVSLETIARGIGLSRERVRQIRDRALNKIKLARRGKVLVDFLS